MQLTATSRRRKGKLALDTTVPRPEWIIHSERLDADMIDHGGRVSPGNARRLAALVRRLHTDAQEITGLVTWSVLTPDGHSFREVAVPTDWIVECGDGTARVVPDREAG